MKHLFLLAMVFSLPLITSCERKASAVTAPAPVITKVTMQNMQYSPTSVVIEKGGTVEWTNKDLTPHTVTSPAFGDSGALMSDKSWSHQFNEVGEFPYGCTFHPTMKGTVIVK